MSKLGKKPIIIPKDTQVKLESGKLILTGPKGSKELTLNDKIFTATIDDKKSLILKLIKKNETTRVMWGTTRSVINSALIGVSTGYERILELTGVGFRANLKGDILNLQIGYSHDVSGVGSSNISKVNTVATANIAKIIGVDLYGITASGSKRWINLYFINLQPSELMKIALIIF